MFDARCPKFLLRLIESPEFYYADWKTNDQQQVSVLVWCSLEMAVGVRDLVGRCPYTDFLEWKFSLKRA